MEGETFLCNSFIPISYWWFSVDLVATHESTDILIFISDPTVPQSGLATQASGPVTQLCCGHNL